MKPTRVEFVRQAAEELAGAVDWYKERSTLAALEFLQDVEHALQLALQRPLAWPAFEAGTRRIVLQHYPFSIIFRQEAGVVHIIAVAHHRRRPGYGRRRRSSPTRR